MKKSIKEIKNELINKINSAKEEKSWEEINSAKEEKSWEEFNVDIARWDGQIYAYEDALSLLEDVEELQRCRSCHKTSRPQKPTNIQMPEVSPVKVYKVFHQSGDNCPECKKGELYEKTLMDAFGRVLTCNKCEKTFNSTEIKKEK